MSIERPLGWRRDPPDAAVQYRSGHAQIARARLAGLDPLETCSFLRFEPEQLFQGHVGSCVSVGTKAMFLDFCAANHLERFEVSERALYWQSRVLEYEDEVDADESRKAVAAAGDVGAFPWLAFRAWHELGLVDYEDCPGREPITPDEVQAFVEVQPAPIVFEQGYERRGLERARLDGFGVDLVRQVAACLQNRMPVGWGQQVDLAFLRNQGEIVERHDPHLSQGGHWMRVLGVISQTNNDGSSIGSPPTDEAEVLPWLMRTEIKDPREVSSLSIIVASTTWRDHGLPNGMLLFRAGHWAVMARDVTAVRWLPARGVS